MAGCRRQQVYRIQGLPPSPSRPPDEVGEDAIAAKMGNAIEPDTNALLEAIGLEVANVQASWAIMSCGQRIVCSFDTEEVNDKFIEANIEAHKGDGVYKVPGKKAVNHADCYPVCTGHPDGVIIGGLDNFLGGKAPDGPVLLEVKYMNFKRFIGLANTEGGIVNLDDDGTYYTQTQLNMEALGPENTLFLAFAKDKTAVKWNRGRGENRYEGHAFMHVEVVEKSKGAVKFGLERAEEVNRAVEAGELPAPDYTPVGDERSSSWQCRWCDWHTQCLLDLGLDK